MSVFYDLNKTPRNILNQAIVRAIVSENNGAWFDPSDLSTLFQDAAGTIPVTAVEQPVGKMLDKSGNGYHATQSITASRPTLSARKNILLATEALATQSVTTLAAQYTLSFTGTGSITLSGTTTGTLTGTGVNDRVSLTVTPTAGTLTLTVSGSVTKAQLELGASAGPYQRVNTATDYDTDERYFPKYLRFDGVDDYLNLPYMGLYAAGSASVVSAISNVVTSAGYILGEGNSADNDTRYGLQKIEENKNTLRIVSDVGAIIANVINTVAQSNGIPHVLSNIDTGSSILTASNGVVFEALYNRTSAVTTNSTTIGVLLATTNIAYFNGNLYGLIITKSALTDSQRIACERYLGRKSGVQL